jgi:hypothetical protein
MQERQVLSWDEVEKWCVGCQVLVARELDRKIIPFFGVIVSADDRYFEILINGQVVTYKKVQKGSADAIHFYENIRKNIKQDTEKKDLEEQVNVVILEYGAKIATQIGSALGNDLRFIFYEQRWYLQKWIPKIARGDLQNIHHQIFKTTKQASLSQLVKLMPELPEGEFSEIAMKQVLVNTPGLFLPCGDGWQVVPPPPPPWQKAIGAYYVYDPMTYEIILKPGERIKKKVADRLVDLGFYADVVEPADD